VRSCDYIDNGIKIAQLKFLIGQFACIGVHGKVNPVQVPGLPAVVHCQANGVTPAVL
jgi:hypothetical protein